MPISLPESCERVRSLDPSLGRIVEDDFLRVLRVGEALAWAQGRLPALVAARTPSAVLDVVVGEARAQTMAPSVFAIAWSQRRDGGTSFRALAGSAASEVVPDAQISSTIVGQVAASGRPAWSDDAQVDARFLASHSVQGFALRSVGCVPLGAHGALYLCDPERPGLFTQQVRARLVALCTAAAPFLGSPSEPPPRPASAAPIPGMVGDSPVMRELFAQIRAFAPMPWPALVLGETGSGKEGVARALHDLSPRSSAPFVAVNCGAIPEELAESTLFGHERGAFTGADRQREGLVERVGEGTLFLDEVGELSPRAQVKLLRLLQERTFERVGGQRELQFRGRVVAATLRNLDDPTAQHGFRDDLFHRLAACVLRVPPLRKRLDDAPALAEHLLLRALSQVPNAPALRLSDAANQALQRHAWPGNVRELENALRMGIAHAMAAGSEVILPEQVFSRGAPSAAASGATLPQGLGLQEAVDDLQRRMVARAIDECDGSRTRAAEQLGVTRQWLHRLLQRWDEGEA